MEHMDYTMESEHPPNHVSRCPYFHQMSRPLNHLSHRDGSLAYDPISHRDARYSNGTNMSSQQRPTFSSHIQNAGNLPTWTSDFGWYGVGEQQQHPHHHHQQAQHHPQHYNSHHQISRSTDASGSRPPHLTGNWGSMSNVHQLPFGYGFSSTGPSIPHGAFLDRGSSDNPGSIDTNESRMMASAGPTSAPQPYLQPAMNQGEGSRSSSESNNSGSVSLEPTSNPQNRSSNESAANRTARALPSSRYSRHTFGIPSEEARPAQFRPNNARNTHPLSAASRSRQRGLSYNSSDGDAEDEESEDPLDRYHREIYLNEESAMATMRSLNHHGKLVASQSAIASLEKVEVKSLPEADRTCIICYNEFNVQNPEGVVEVPLRLPRCKHVFGDKCIKKWFQDSDSCPYCRDKVPSESSRPRLLMARISEQQQQAMRASRMNLTNLSTRHSLSDEHSGPFTSLRTRDLASYQADQMAVQQGYPEQRNTPYIPNRPGYPESPENRRRRGRLGVGRALPPPNRPTSVGPSRFNVQQTLFRNMLSVPPIPHARNSFPTRDNQQMSVPNGTSATSSPESLSPPVVVGSSTADTEYPEPPSQPSSENQSNSQWHESALDFLTRDEHNSASQRPVINNSGSHSSSPPRTFSTISPFSRQYSTSDNSVPRSNFNAENNLPDRPFWPETMSSASRIPPFQYSRWSG